jgi:3-oxoacyl-(acyl-carrier-protein) synthase
VTGVGALALPPARPAADEGSDALQREVTPWLKSRKMRKFMGKQDQLAVVAAGRAAADAALDERTLQERAGLYLCVGHIPFDGPQLEAIAAGSVRDGQFCMERFSTTAFERANPLLTFRCLPNMPAFHVSLNLGMRGPYLVTYPCAGQFYLALESAAAALESGEVEAALVGGVADQNNFLVAYHFCRGRGRRALDEWEGVDAAAFLCLEKRDAARRHGAAVKAELLSTEVRYAAPYPSESPRPFAEDVTFAGARVASERPTAASLPLSLSRAAAGGEKGELVHRLSSESGIEATSRWRVL